VQPQLALSLLVLVLCTHVASAQVALRDCTLGEVASRCGTLSVFEDRDSRKGRKIALNFVVIPATTAGAKRSAVVFVPGGPGEAATAAKEGYAGSPLRSEHDIVLLDLRGTGGSHPLRCAYQDEPGRGARYLADFMPAEGLRRCASELRAKADLRFYTTPYAADDLDELRAALGYDSLNLIGGSYGTRFVLAYMRQHPARVRSAILYGPSPTHHTIPLTTALDAEHALQSLLADCADDAACGKRFPDVRARLTRVLRELEASPRTVPVRDPSTGAEVAVVVNRATFTQAIRYMLYRPSNAARIPLAVDLASRGEFGDIALFALGLGTLFNGDPEGLYNAVTCAEDVAFVDLPAARALAAGTFLGMERVRTQREACRHWSGGNLPPAYREPVRSQAPVLLVVGERDPATPPRLAQAVAETLPNSRVIIVRDGAHSFDGLQGIECLRELDQTFIRTASIDAVRVDCAATAAHPPFVFRSARESMVAMSADELKPFAGTYEGDGLTLTVTVAPPGITGTVGGMSVHLIPVGDREFVDDIVMGVTLRFELQNGSVTAVRLIKGTDEGMRLMRK
jgi:pimeloyl-ACP methyl ester carboxylesterase